MILFFQLGRQELRKFRNHNQGNACADQFAMLKIATFLFVFSELGALTLSPFIDPQNQTSH